MGLEPTLRKQEVQGDDTRVVASPLDRSTGGTTKRGSPAGTLAHGVSSVDRTHRGTLELVGRTGKKTWRFLIDSGSTGNYVSAQVCTVHGLMVREDPKPDQLTMADGSKTETTSLIRLTFKCGEYRGSVQAKIFPGLQKPMILGFPWLQRENPQIDWAQKAVVVNQGQKWIELPL